MAFYVADVDGDQQLSYDEFMSIVPQGVNLVDVQHLFQSVDIDRSGFITLDEFFVWTLSYVEEMNGAGLEAVFRRYDVNGEGTLDAREFALAAEDLGFGPIAHDIFLELDPDESGNITHGELISFVKNAARARMPGVSNSAKNFLVGLAYEASAPPRVLVDAAPWTVKSSSECREKIIEIVATHDLRVYDIFRIMMMDENTEHLSGFAKFILGMERIGYAGKDKALLEQIFREIDADGSGSFGMHDLHMWIHNRAAKSRKQKARKLVLLRKQIPGIRYVTIGGAQYPCPLRQVIWDVQSLRKALQVMLIHGSMAPLDMLRAWDSDGSGSFSKQEFLHMLKKIVHDADLWDEELRDVACRSFKEAAKGDNAIDVVEYEQWLNTGWLQMKTATTQNKEEDLDRRKRLTRSATSSTTISTTVSDLGKDFNRMPSDSEVGIQHDVSHVHRGLNTKGSFDVGGRRGYKGAVYEQRRAGDFRAASRELSMRSVQRVSSMLLLPAPVYRAPPSRVEQAYSAVPSEGTKSPTRAKLWLLSRPPSASSLPAAPPRVWLQKKSANEEDGNALHDRSHGVRQAAPDLTVDTDYSREHQRSPPRKAMLQSRTPPRSYVHATRRSIGLFDNPMRMIVPTSPLKAASHHGKAPTAVSQSYVRASRRSIGSMDKPSSATLIQEYSQVERLSRQTTKPQSYIRVSQVKRARS